MDVFPKDILLDCLQTGKLELQGQFIPGSNYTLLVEVISPPGRFIAVYKPVRGERPLWDFPYGSLEKREAAAYLVSEALGWELVPPVVFRMDGPLGPGSVQVYIEHDPNYHYFNFSPADIERTRPVVVFDLLINNADRKGGHFLIDNNRHIWLIDHGLCFHKQDKLRTVVWDFSGTPIPDNLLADVEEFLHKLTNDEPLQQNLGRLILPEEIDALRQRGMNLLKSRVFPKPDEKQRQFPWPPV
ncbi:MAG: SCO1664 family protein [Chloroflexi bacterium]|nr:SCO1664 family protein [Chloroflexota bacterium]